MAGIARALRRVGEELADLLEPAAIRQACREAGHAWRERVLDPVTTVHLLVLQVLHGNAACAHVRHLGGPDVTASGYCQARARLPLAVVGALLGRSCRSLRHVACPGPSAGLWRGHRAFHVDGSTFSMPDTPPLQARFGQSGNQRPGCGFPTAHLLVLMDAATGLIADLVASPLRTHDLARAPDLHPALGPGDVLVGDRIFCSFAHLAALCGRGPHAVFRAQHRLIVDFRARRPHTRNCGRRTRRGRPRSRWVARLGAEDQVVEWLKPVARPAWMDAEQYRSLPGAVRLRELRYRIVRPGVRTGRVTLVTTLLDPRAYPKGELAGLYRGRWAVETNLRHLKQAMGMDVLRCRTEDGVLKELYAFALVYNLVRLVMLEAARRQGADPGRVSFVDALWWLCHARPGGDLPDLVVNPTRAGRVEPRVVKRRPKAYAMMTKPRDELRKALLKPSPA